MMKSLDQLEKKQKVLSEIIQAQAWTKEVESDFLTQLELIEREIQEAREKMDSVVSL